MELKNFFAQDDEGNKLPGADCYVYLRGTETLAPGVVKANGVSLVSPFQSDANGLTQFAAPNGLYDVRVVKGKRDYRLPMQFNDVTDSISAAEYAADRAEMARDAALQAKGLASSVQEGLLKTVSGEYFCVPGDNPNTYITLYRNEGGAAIESGRAPSLTALQGMMDLMTQNDSSLVHSVLDEHGFAWGAIDSNGFDLPGLKVVPDTAPGLRLLDEDGFSVLEDTPDRTSFGAMTWSSIPYPGIWIVDDVGFVESNLNKIGVEKSLPDVTPYLAKEICGVDGVPLTLYLDGMFQDRDDTDPVRATIAADLNPAIFSSTEAIRFVPGELGTAAKLYTRPLRATAAEKTVLGLNVRSAPNPPAGPAPAPRILLFADSIGNHQGPMLLEQFLTAWGYAPTFVGTYPSSAAESDGWNRLGHLAEAKQSWSGNQFTYEDTTRSPIAVGGEQAYLAGTKPSMSGFNPFIRIAVAGDPPELVKNGYIFDPAFYQSRFSLDTPDIIINALGTNDIRDQESGNIYSTIYENDLLFHRQFRSAWPSVKIIRCLPGAARNQGDGARDRDGLWSTHYIPAIRAILDARRAINDSNVSVASSWAFYSQEAGYLLADGTEDVTTGSIVAELSDWLHPQGSTRRQYYQYLAGHVACVAAGLI